MNKIINRFSFDRDKFMPEIHLRQPRFPYSAYRPFTKNKERIQKRKFKKARRFKMYLPKRIR